MHGTRTDCTRDNRQTALPNVSTLGYNETKCRRGYWIVYDDTTFGAVRSTAGRVVGRVHCEGKTYVEAIVTNAGFTMAHVRWIDPTLVRECYKEPHHAVIKFLMGEWHDADTILRTANRGFVRP